MELPILPSFQGVFVTGTDTGVGKTWIAGGLTAFLRQQGRRAGYFKPIQSGCPEERGRLIPTDALWVRELAGLTDPLELLTPIALSRPLAPGVAADLEGVTLDLEKVAGALRELVGRLDFLVVEGAGGLYVPLIGTEFLVLDLVRWLGLPLLVVARAGLGTINHTTLTVMAARQAGIQVAGIVLNRYPAHPGLAERTNPEVIEAITGTPILGKIPEVPDLDHPAGRESFLAALAGVGTRLLGGRGRGSQTPAPSPKPPSPTP
jgi:dethiobiotin synthetase